MAIGIAVALVAIVGRQDVVRIVVVLAKRQIPSAGNGAARIRGRLTGIGVNNHVIGMHVRNHAIDKAGPETGAHATAAGVRGVPTLRVADRAGGIAYLICVRRIRAAPTIDDKATVRNAAAVGIAVASDVVHRGIGRQSGLTEIASRVRHSVASVHIALIINAKRITGVITCAGHGATALGTFVDRRCAGCHQVVAFYAAVVGTTAAMMRIGLRVGALPVAALKVAAARDRDVVVVCRAALLAASFLSRCGGVADAVSGHTGATDQTTGAISANAGDTVSIRMCGIPAVD